ncbi:MAG: hypothetical protein LJE91_15960 [Gammaproteobacteria bacterium]|jgi:hypothetical protein|nr:hypothetical protein [Gammaproteobacteria bacterium]
MAEKDTTDATKAEDKPDTPTPGEKSGAGQEPMKTSAPEEAESAPEKKSAPKKKSAVKKKAAPRKKTVKKASPAAGAAAASTTSGNTVAPAQATTHTPRKVATAKPVSTKAGLLPWVILASAIAVAAYLYEQPQSARAPKGSEAARPATSTTDPQPVIAGKTWLEVEEVEVEEVVPSAPTVEPAMTEVRQPAPVSLGDAPAPPDTEPQQVTADVAPGDGTQSDEATPPISADRPAVPEPQPVAGGQPQIPDTPAVTEPSQEPQAVVTTDDLQPTASQGEGAAGEPAAEAEERATRPVDPRQARRQEMLEARARMLSERRRPPARPSPYPYYNPGWAPRPYSVPGYGSAPENRQP